MTENYPSPVQAIWTAKNFKFHKGEIFPELKIGYTTVGNPSGIPVLILHGTAGTGSSMLTPSFAGELFGPDQVLDASKYFIILPDAIGMGRSSKPSDGLRTAFPRYNYEDMVHAQYRLITEGLGIKHLRLILGFSMGGMHTWLWATQHPTLMDILVPMASTPAEMSGRNWLTRRLILDSIRNDPAWMQGHYTEQPPSFKFATVFFGVATNGGNQALQQAAATREQADALLDARLNAPLNADANDHLYQWDASRDYNPSPDLEKIKARVLAINSADDERNPPELGIMQAALQRIPDSRLLLIPSSPQTSGHSTVGHAKWWKNELATLLNETSHQST